MKFADNKVLLACFALGCSIGHAQVVEENFTAEHCDWEDPRVLGIYRPVQLWSRPLTHIADYYVEAEYPDQPDGSSAVTARLQIANSGKKKAKDIQAILCIDLNIHGVGGVNTWGTCALPQYTIDGNKPYHYAFMLKMQ